MQDDTKQPTPKPRGRPRAYDPDAALGAARDAFWSAGYSATSLDDLAAVTGMNRPSLYAAFGNKQALYLKTLGQLGTEMAQQVGAVLGAPIPLREALRRFYLNALTLYLSGEEGPRGCFIVCTATVEAHEEPEVRAFLGQTLRHIDDALIARFGHAIAQGELPADADAETLGRLAASVLHSLAVRARAGQSRASLKRLVDGAVNLLTAAV
jgi:TetR/AcrR family transcriptional regulator, copper-responsive repressor